MNNKVKNVILVLVALLLLIPFIFISHYNNPSSDDYRFVFYTSTLGLWEAQVHWYLTWVGRYFSTFLLSLHPLLIKSTLLYKVVPIILIFLSVHSIYRFINTLIKTKIIALLLALYILFYYLTSMPSLVQGI